MWRETTKHARNRRIFEQELDWWLPDTILDFHVHLMNPGVLPEGETLSCAGHPISAYTVEDLNQDLTEAYPARKTLAVCFGFPNQKYDMEANNRYLAAKCDGRRFFALRLFDPSQKDAKELRRDILESGFLGLKPYPDYVPKSDKNEVEIDEMLPAWVMDVANELGLAVMLHLPRKMRLADPLNQKQLTELCLGYPQARIILAHIGRAYYLKNVIGQLDVLKGLPNLWYDVSMLNNWEVLEVLFKTVAPDKVLYGTDIPLALAPGKSIEINDQYTYVTPVPWELSISDDHEKLVFTSFLYEELRAIRKAVERLGLDAAFLRGLFSENGLRLIGAVSEAISGHRNIKESR